MPNARGQAETCGEFQPPDPFISADQARPLHANRDVPLRIQRTEDVKAYIKEAIRDAVLVRCLSARPARPPHLAGVARQPADLGQRTPQHELDLGVRAAQLVVSPPGKRLVDSRIQPQQDALALGHVTPAGFVTGTRIRY